MTAGRKLAAILAADVVGYSRQAGVDEERILARLRALRSDLIDPTIAVHGGRVVKRTGDGLIVEFRSVVDAVKCAIEIQNAMVERNVGVVPDKRIEFRVGIHLGDVVEEADGDLMGDGVNIAARLEGVAAPGAICLSEDAYRQVRDRISEPFADLGEKELKNIARPVQVYALWISAPAQTRSSTPVEPVAAKRRWAPNPLAVGMAALLLTIAAGAWYILASYRSPPLASNTPPEARHLSIVVLPFTNLSGDPAQDYFADGITEDLTTDLSRIRNSFVIARNTAFTFKDKGTDAKEIGKDLGVRYVLEGSVHRDQSRVRVNAQLIDAESGAHVWADRFEEDVADLFKLQDQVVARLANTLGFELVKAEAQKSAGSKNPDAIDLTMRGLALLQHATSQSTQEQQESLKAALALFGQALKIDPNDADALAGEAATYHAEYQFGWTSPETDLEAKIIGQADRAIALDPNNARAYFAKASYLMLTHRADEARRAADSGLAINPNFAPLYGARSAAETSLGNFAAAKSDAQQAVLLSPRDPLLGLRHINIGIAELGLGRLDAAVDEFHDAIEAGYSNFIPYADLAAAYALEGKTGEAKTALGESLRLNPKLTVKWLKEHAPDVPPLFDGLTKAGLPEE